MAQRQVMPSLQQLRYEELAAKVERATHPFGLRTFGEAIDPPIVRVERIGGSIIEFKVKEVVLDGGVLVGRDAAGPLSIPLSEVKTLWRHRYHFGRSALVVGAVILVTTAGMALESDLSVKAIALGGPLLGFWFGLGACVLINQMKVLDDWVLLYDRDS
jgi:hypothetical protein